jgi:tape measure domain-containing protein
LSHTISIDVASEQLQGISTTIEEGLGSFAAAAEKLQLVSKSAKDEFSVDEDIKKLKAALGTIAADLHQTTLTEKVKIATAMSEIGVALHQIAAHIHTIDPTQQINTEIGGVIQKFSAALRANLVVNQPAASAAAISPVATIAPVQSIDITGRVSEAILAKHFVVTQVDITKRVASALSADTFTVKPIDLTSRLQMAIDSMDIQASPTSERSPRQSNERIDISGEDLLSKIHIGTVNITELIAEAIGSVDLSSVLERAVKHTEAPKQQTAPVGTDDALQRVLNTFENFTAQAETEALAAGEQIQVLDRMRSTLGKIDKKFLDLHGSQTSTVALFADLGESVKTIAAQFASLASDVQKGTTTPQAAAEQAVTLTANERQNIRFRETSRGFVRDIAGQNEAVEMADTMGVPGMVEPLKQQRDKRLQTRAEELAAQGRELAIGTPDANSLSTYAAAMLNFQEQIKEQSADVKNAVAEALKLTSAGKTNLLNGKNYTSASYFSKAKGEIGAIPGLADALKQESASGDYQNIGYTDQGEASNNAKGMSGIGRAPSGASKNLRELLQKSLASSMTGDISATDLVTEIKSKVKAAEDTLTELDKQIVADHFRAFAAKAKDLDGTQSKTPAIDKAVSSVGDGFKNAQQSIANTANMLRAWYIATSENAQQLGDAVNAAKAGIGDVAQNIRNVPKKVQDRAKADTEKVKDTIATGREFVAPILKRAKDDTQKVKDAVPTGVSAAFDGFSSVNKSLDTLKTAGVKIWGVGQQIGEKAADFQAAGRRRKRGDSNKHWDYDIDYTGSQHEEQPETDAFTPKLPKQPRSRYNYAKRVAVNNSNLAVPTNLSSVGAEATNQLERTDFSVLVKDSNIKELKRNIDKRNNGSKKDRKEANEYIESVRSQISDLPEGTRIPTLKLLNRLDRSDTEVKETAKNKTDRKIKADATAVARDARQVYKDALQEYKQSVIQNIPKSFGDLISAAKALPSENRSTAKTEILRLKQQRDSSVNNQKAESEREAEKQLKETERQQTAADKKRDTLRYQHAVSVLNQTVLAIEAKAYENIDEAEIRLTEAAKNVRQSASVMNAGTQRSARSLVNKSLKNGLGALREPVEAIVPISTDGLRSLSTTVEINERQQPAKTDHKDEQQAFKRAQEAYRQKFISYGELRELFAQLPETLIDQNSMAMVDLARAEAKKLLTKAKSPKDQSTAKILGRIQVAQAMGDRGDFSSYGSIVSDVKENHSGNQQVVLAANKLSLQRRGYAVKNTSTDDLIAIENADKTVQDELDRRYKKLTASYTQKLTLAIKEANVDDKKSSVEPDVRIPQEYLVSTKPQQIDYRRSQEKIDERKSKSKALELRDTATPEALAELEAGMKQKLFGYASAFKQLSKTLTTTGNKELNAEIENLKIQFKLTGSLPDFDKAIGLYRTELEQQKLAILHDTFTDKIARKQEIGFNKTLKSAKSEFEDTGAVDTSTLQTLSTSAVTSDQKTAFSLFQKDLAEKIQKSINDRLSKARSAIEKLIREGKLDEAKTTVDASPNVADMGDLQTKILGKRRAAGIDSLKTAIAASRNNFDPEDVERREAVPATYLRGRTKNRETFGEQETANSENLILSYQNWVKNQIKTFDNHRYDTALELAQGGDLSELKSIVSNGISTRTKDAAKAVEKLTSEFQQMTETERTHVASARAAMNAARSDRTTDRPQLIRDAIVTDSQLVPRGTKAYKDNIQYINNQGKKSLEDTEGAAKAKSFGIQDIAGLYYTLKSVTANVVESLQRLNVAATATEKTMRKLSIVNGGDIGRDRKDIEGGKALSQKYGGSERSYIDNIARYKASVPVEYDKFGTQLPAKVSDDGLRTIVDGLTAAGTVNQLSADNMNNAAMAIEQMFSKDAVQSEELKRQLANSLPGVVSQFAQSQGIDTKELNRRMSAGEVGVNSLEKFGAFQQRLYGEKAQQGSLTKELNTLSGNTEDITNKAAGDLAKPMELGLSIANAIVAGLKANAGTLGLALLPAFAAIGGVVAKVFVESTLNNDLVKPFKDSAISKVKSNAAPIGLLAGGLAVSALGTKFGGEQSIDNAMGKFVVNLGYATEGLGRFFSGLTPKEATEKSNGSNSTLAGMTLIGAAGISALRKNTNFIDRLSDLNGFVNQRFAAVESLTKDKAGSAASAVARTVVNTRENLKTMLSGMAESAQSAVTDVQTRVSVLGQGIKEKATRTGAVMRDPFTSAILAESSIRGQIKEFKKSPTFTDISAKANSWLESLKDTSDKISIGFNDLKSKALAAAKNPLGAAYLAQSALNQNIAPISAGIRQGVDVAKTAAANPLVTGVLLENSARNKIGEIKSRLSEMAESASNSLQSIGQRSKDFLQGIKQNAVTGTSNARSSLTQGLQNFAGGIQERVSSWSSGRSEVKELTESQKQSRQAIGSAMKEVGISFGLSMVALAVANTEFVSEYGRQLRDTMKSLEVARLAATPAKPGDLGERVTVKQLKQREDTGFSIDSFIGFMQDSQAIGGQESKSNARLEQQASLGDRAAQKILEDRQSGKTVRSGGLRQYGDNAKEEARQTLDEVLTQSQNDRIDIGDNSRYTETAAKAQESLDKIKVLKQRKKAAIDAGASEDEKTKIDSETIKEEREFAKISKPLTERRNSALAAVKALDVAKSNYLESSNFRTDTEEVKRATLAKIEVERNKQVDLAEKLAESMAKWDLAGMVAIVTKEFETQVKQIDRELSKSSIKDTESQTSSTKTRLNESDDTNSSIRKADSTIESANTNSELLRRKLELAKKYEEAIQYLPSSADQEAKLQDAIDKRIAAEKEYASSLGNQAQAELDKQKAKEDKIQTETDRELSSSGNARSRSDTQIKTNADVVLNTRQQTDIDQETTDAIEQSAVEKTREVYDKLREIAGSIKVNKTAFDQKLDAAKTEYENSIANLDLSRKLRAKEQQQRKESYAVTDYERAATRADTEIADRKNAREPLPAVSNTAAYDRQKAATNYDNALDDLSAAKAKAEEFAKVLASIQSPDLKVEKTIEYEKLVSDTKKKVFEAEVARLNQLKAKYDALKALIESINTSTTTRLNSSSSELNILNQNKLRDAGYAAVNSNGKSDNVLTAQAKVEAANRGTNDVQARLRNMKAETGLAITTASSSSAANGVPYDGEFVKSTLNRISDDMVGDGKDKRGVMEADATSFIAGLQRSLDTAMANRKGEEDVTAVASLGDRNKSITASPDVIKQIISNLKDNVVPIVAAKNTAENERVSANQELKVAKQQAAKELSDATRALDVAKASANQEMAAIERDAADAAKAYDRKIAVLGSTASDSSTRTSAENAMVSIDNNLADRQSGKGETEGKTRKDLLDKQIESLKSGSIVDRTQGSMENRKLAEKNLEKAIHDLTSSYEKTNLSGDKSIADSIHTMGEDYAKTAAIARQTYTTLADSLLSLQKAGTDLLMSYGVNREKTQFALGRRDANDRYTVETGEYDRRDVGLTAEIEAISKVTAQNESVREFGKTLDYGKPTNAKAALTELDGKATRGEINSPIITNAVRSVLKDIDMANLSNEDAQKVFAKLSAMVSSLTITAEESMQIANNARRLALLNQASEINDSNAAGVTSKLKARESDYRHGSVLSSGDIRQADDLTTEKYNNQLASIRAKTEAAIIASGGTGTLKGKIEQQKGVNAERELQAEYSDLPLYGKQFTSDIREAVTSATKFSTIFRDAIEKGDWSDVFSGVMRGILTKLADTYSDRASKQLGDFVGGGLDSLFKLNSPLTGQVAQAEGMSQPEPLELRTLFNNGENFDLATLFTDSRTGIDGLNTSTGEISATDFLSGNTIGTDMSSTDILGSMDFSSIGDKLSSSLGGVLSAVTGGSSGSSSIFGSLMKGFGGLFGFADGKMSQDSWKSGESYPNTPTQDSREPNQSKLAVINSKELVLPPSAAKDYLDYRREQSMGGSSMVSNNSQSTVINNYNTSNYRNSAGSTFGETAQSRKDSRKSRFDKN